MQKKLLSLVAFLLLSPILVAMLNMVSPVFAVHTHDAFLFIDGNPAEKPYWNGKSAVNFTFQVKNLPESSDNITIVVISWADSGYKVDRFFYPTNWGAVYEPALKQITFESQNYNAANIAPGKTESFTILFSQFPSAEGKYEFIVSTTDVKKEGYVTYPCWYLDTREPKVTLVFPTEDGYVFDKGADVWINATATDDANSPYPSAVNPYRVFAKVQNSRTNILYQMNYDPVASVYYAHWKWGEGPITDDGWNYTYHVEAWDWANNWARGPATDYKFFWYLKEGITPYPGFGPVGTKVTITGRGFDSLSTGNIRFFDHIFDLGQVCTFTTNKYGLFEATCTIPETPAKIYWFNASDVSGIWATAKFEVIPWITMSPTNGAVGTTVTIKGTGFVNSTKIELWYGGVSNERLDYSTTEYTTWDGSTTWWIRTVGEGQKVANPVTSPKGSFEATFAIPESWGGYHPIWVNWIPEVLDKYGSTKPNEQIFRVLPAVNLNPSNGVSGQLVTLSGTGFSKFEYYRTWTQGITVPEDFQTNPAAHVIYPTLIQPETGVQSYNREETGLVVDFGPDKRYIDESHYILNGEASSEWYENLCGPFTVDAMGTIVYMDTLHKMVGSIGSQFLQVPFLQPGTYDVTVYRFNMRETGQLAHSYSKTESKTIQFSLEKTTVNADVKNLEDLLKQMNGTLNTIKPVIMFINDTTVQINTEVGRIEAKLDDIKPRIIEIQGNVVTIQTILGTINGTVGRIEATCIRIDTTVGNIWTKIKDIDFTKLNINMTGVAQQNTLEAQQGTLKDIQAIVGMSTLTIPITAVLSAFAAIAAVAAVVVVVRRLKVAS